MFKTTRTGVVAAATYLPKYRLTAEEIGRTQKRSTNSRAQRRLAGFDEDALTMAVAAARKLPDLSVDQVLFCTTTPPYVGKNNASAAHAALNLPESTCAFDAGGSFRSAVGAFATARPRTLVLLADVSTSKPGAATELSHGDGAAAIAIGPADESIAEIEKTVSITDEFLDHYRLSSSATLSSSEDRFAPSQYAPMLGQAIEQLGLTEVDHIVISAPAPRVAQMAQQRVAKIGPIRGQPGIGYAGSADLAIQISAVLATAQAGQSILAISLADGVDAVLLRCTELLEENRPQTLPAADDGVAPPYIDALVWRGLLEREPPRRPEPNQVSAPASARSVRWKFALQAASCSSCGAVSAPPQKVCVRCGSQESTGAVDLSVRHATVKTFSVDRLAFSPNPPLIAAVVDFDGGGRLEVELTDTQPENVSVGQRVQMSLRRRHSSGGVHNYGWKAVPLEQEHGK
jgi:hydroxymethylglutaryl-CoA synthase